MRTRRFVVRIIALVSVFLFNAGVASALATVVRHVNAAHPGASGDGLTWESAKNTLQEALNDAQAGDEIWVAAGIYRPSARTDPAVPRSATFQLMNGVAIYGGFVGTETQRDPRYPAVNETILSGDLNRDDACPGTVTSNCCSPHEAAGCDPLECAELVCAPGVMEVCCDPNQPFFAWQQGCVDKARQLCDWCLCHTGSTAENSYHVVTATGTDDSAVLGGFIIKAGHSTGSTTADLSGAGAYIGNGSPKLVGCMFLTNVAAGNGGAIFVDGGNPALTNCSFLGNTAVNGGAVGLINGNPTFTSCTFHDNSEAQKGGGVYMEGGSPTFTGCTFDSNDATNYGGAIFVDGGNPALTNCSFLGNAAVKGGGVYMEGGNPTFTGCTFDSNAATNYGGGVYNSGGKPTLNDCTFRENTAVWEGGGIYSAESTSPGTTLAGCSFSGNTAQRGAGVALVLATTATLTDCAFTNNLSGTGGGVGIDSGSSASFSECQFLGNTAGDGGGVSVNASSVSLVDCDFESNTATSEGGGLRVAGIGSSVSVTNGTFHDNQASASYGGGIGVYQGSLTLQGVELAVNYAPYGGAVYVQKGAALVIQDCSIHDNGRSGQSVTQTGGGVYSGGFLGQTIARTVIRDNEAAQNGGGIFVTTEINADVTLESCAITGNVSHNEGGGIYSTYDRLPGSLALVNCTVADNHCTGTGSLPTGKGGGLWSNLFDTQVTVENTIFWGNTASEGPQMSVTGGLTVRFSDFQDGPASIDRFIDLYFDWQASNLAVDPLFVDAANGNYHLSPGPPTASPCIDSGDNGLVAGSLDCDRGPRIFGCIVDRGAYEYSGNTDSSGLCLTPTAVAGGARYLSVTPTDQGSTPVALLVTGDSCDSTVSCIDDRYVQSKCVGGSNNGDNCNTDADCPKRCVGGQFPNRDCTIATDCPQGECRGSCSAGTLGSTPFYKTTAQWGTAKVRGAQIRPETTYMVHTECNFGGPPVLSTPASARTWKWGDVNNNGVVNALDITNLVNFLKGFYGPYTFEQMNLFGCTPDAVINALDIAMDVDAVRGFGFPCSASCACVDEADLRADLDGDGDIDADDNALEATGVLYFVVNSDDDNGDGLEDYLNDGPVPNEDDLVEIRMSAKCRALNPATAWWKISWEDDPVNPALKVWLNPDKSDGQGGVGTQIENDAQNFSWPPPQSIWLEATHSYDTIELTLTIPDNSVLVPTAGQGTKTTTLAVASPCTPAYVWSSGRRVRPQGGIIGATAMIETQNTILCVHAYSQLPLWALSAAWISVGEQGRWAQVGYAHKHDGESEGPHESFAIYIETFVCNDTSDPSCYDIAFFDAPDPGSHEYRLDLSQVLGAWFFYYDGIQLDVSDSPTWHGWVGRSGNRVTFSAEIHNFEDQMVGHPADKCRFGYCQYMITGGAYYDLVYLTQSELSIKGCRRPSFLLQCDEVPAPPDEWGVELAEPQGQPPVSPHIDIWDEHPF